jgi:NADH dehydrogenase subunit A (EC 1.6.5.3)
MLTNYIPIAVAIGLAIAVAGGMVLMSHIIGLLEAKPKRGKLAAYECGNEPIGDARHRFPVKFYVIAMLFIVFDIEVVFFYPWAVIYRELGSLALTAMAVFLGILVIGYIYLLRTGAFEWEWWERERLPEEVVLPVERPAELAEVREPSAVLAGGENR